MVPVPILDPPSCFSPILLVKASPSFRVEGEGREKSSSLSLKQSIM